MGRTRQQVFDQGYVVRLTEDVFHPDHSRSFMNKPSFGDLFLRNVSMLAADFGATVFRLCVCPQGTPLARLIWYLRRAYFQPDFELIEQVRNLTSSTEVRLELNRVRYYHPATGLFRGFLRVRISGQRLLNLADGLFAGTG